MWADAEVVRHIGGRTFTREEAWHRLLRYLGHWQVAGFGHWFVRETTTGMFCGEVGLMDSRRATEPLFEDTPEAGWAFVPRAQGKGLAREAVAAMLGWADGHGIARTVCIIDPAHTRSIQLAQTLGYQAAGEIRYRDAPILLFNRCARQV